MKYLFIGVFCLSSCLTSFLAKAAPLPEPSDALLYQLKSSLVKVNTTTKTGGHGLGTAVAVSSEDVVTNCHVINGANGISISKWGTEYPVESIKADWKHDLCILHVQYADLKPAQLGDSSQLSYEQPLISITMPSDSPAPYVALSAVKALYPLDNQSVIRSQAAFAIGASGSPLFDYDGKLVGISTFKSPGRHAYFYNMSVNWVKALMQQGFSKLNTAHDAPFWDAPEPKRPFFMRIVLPFQYERWQEVKQIAQAWVQAEPDNAEAWYYQAVAIEHLEAPAAAVGDYNKALSLHPNHPASLLALIAFSHAQGRAEDEQKMRLTLQEINPKLLEEADSATKNEARPQ